MQDVVVKRQKGIQGFIPVTWTVWKAKKLVGIFETNLVILFLRTIIRYHSTSFK